MAKETVTYIIRHREIPIYITNKPTDSKSEVIYSNKRSAARIFNDTEVVGVNMDYHTKIFLHTEDTNEREINV
ncbi:DUF2483 family protein [Staphylococcus sp. GDY8P199P]|uniref:DUF2483 family protein n=1 Tax=Staphylococcus sp. GDY8P199P TaxID=2804175 RepID=UPI001AEC46EC|nr:DUF2483 family protein [Staphylococcus sp. GDY8P199P]